jgi:hypothetical protein
MDEMPKNSEAFVARHQGKYILQKFINIGPSVEVVNSEILGIHLSLQDIHTWIPHIVKQVVICANNQTTINTYNTRNTYYRDKVPQAQQIAQDINLEVNLKWTTAHKNIEGKRKSRQTREKW